MSNSLLGNTSSPSNVIEIGNYEFSKEYLTLEEIELFMKTKKIRRQLIIVQRW